MTSKFRNIFIRLLGFSIFSSLLIVVFIFVFSVSAQRTDNNEDVLFEVETTPIIQTSAQEIPLFIGLANNSKDGHQIILQSIKINKNDKIIKDISIIQPLFSIRDKIGQINAFEEELENAIDEEGGRKILKQVSIIGDEIRRRSFSTSLRIRVADFSTSPNPGDLFPITITAILVDNYQSKKITKNIIISFASPLPSQPNWYVGDGHVHSIHSEWDANYWYKRSHFFVPGPTVNDQSLAAKNFGLGWLIITDHEEMLDSAEWTEEMMERERAENIYNLPVMIGEEVGSVIPKVSRGHYLAYDIDSYVDASSFSAQDMIDKTLGAGGFGFIAHPDTRPFSWKDWGVAGYEGYELLRGEDKKPEVKTIHRWDNQLEINQKPSIIGTSDAHWPEDVGQTRTYLYIEGPITHNSIYNALKNGNAIITNGPLLTFTINDVIIGETTNVPPGEQATLNIHWTGNEDFGLMKEISVISKSGKVLDHLTKGIQTPTGSINVSYPVTEATYFRLVGESSNGQIVYTNPIWITNYPVIPPLPWSPAVNLSNNTGVSVFPDITTDISGHIHVVWVDNTPGNPEILYSMWDGTSWSEPLNISNTPGYSENPDIIVDNLGYPHVVWNDQPITPANTEIFYTKKNESGWISPVNISKKNWGHSSYPAIALDSFQYPHVVWADPDSLEILYAMWNGTSWSTPINISNTSEYSGRPDIVAIFNNLHVIWEETPPLINSEIYYAVRKEGEDWSSPINISNTSGASGFSSLVSDGLGNLHVVWNDYTFENGEIFYSKLNETGWSIYINISNNPEFSAWPAIASDNYHLYVVWYGGSYDNLEILYSSE